MLRVGDIREHQIRQAKRLRIIARNGVGYDNIDCEVCKELGVVVTNNPGTNAGVSALLWQRWVRGRGRLGTGCQEIDSHLLWSRYLCPLRCNVLGRLRYGPLLETVLCSAKAETQSDRIYRKPN